MFGTVEPWSLAVMEVSCFGLFLLWSFRVVKGGHLPAYVVRPPFLVPLAMLLALGIFQLIPLPPTFVKAISPETYKIYHDVAYNPDNLPWLTLSLYPHATLLEVMRLAAYLCAYFLVMQVMRKDEYVFRMAAAILAAGCLIAVAGIFQVISWNGKLLWLRHLDIGAAFGPYVNKNHFAGLMEMVVPVSVGLGLYLLPPVRRGEGVRVLASDLLTHEHANRLILVIMAVIIMTTSLFLSLSRGGVIGLTASMAFFGMMLSLKSSTRKKGWVMVSVFLVVLLSVGWFGWRPIVQKFESTRIREVSSDFRVNNWRDCLKIVREFPVFGTGLGTYEYVYPRYKTILAPERWEHAHNDYVEGAVELGLAGMALAVYIIASFYLLMFRSLGHRRSLGPRLLGIGGMSGVTAMLIHSLTDFNLHVGANGFFFALIFGFSIAAAHMRPGGEGNGTLLKVGEVISPEKGRISLLAAVAVIFILVSAFSVLNAGADLLFRMANGQTNEGKDLLAGKAGILEKASALSPLDGRYHFALGNIDLSLGRKEEAVRDYSKAVSLDPVNGEYLQMLGVSLEGAGKSVLADRYMRLGVEYDPTSAWRHKNFALWLLSKGRMEEGKAEMRTAISLDPSDTRKFITAMVLSGLTQTEMRSVIPEDAESLILFGNYKEGIEDPEGALQAYLDALSVMKKTGTQGPDIYQRIAALYEKDGLIERAIATYEEGVREIPSDYELRIGLAKLYEKTGVPEKAVAQYEYALRLRPSDQYAENRLKEIKGRQAE